MWHHGFPRTDRWTYGFKFVKNVVPWFEYDGLMVLKIYFGSDRWTHGFQIDKNVVPWFEYDGPMVLKM